MDNKTPDFFSGLITLAHLVPDVVWSGIVASLITLSGVLLSNWGTSSRLKTQLRHDASQKAKDRLAALRREVYLQAAESFVGASRHIVSLADADPATINLSADLAGFFNSAAKVQLICASETSRLVGDLVTTYGQLMLQSLVWIMPLRNLQIDLNLQNDARLTARAACDRLNKRLIDAREDGTIGNIMDARMDELQASYADAFDATSREYLNTLDKQLTLKKDFGKKIINQMRSVLHKQLDVVVAIRLELELDADPAAYKRDMEANWRHIDNHLADTLTALEVSSQVNA